MYLLRTNICHEDRTGLILEEFTGQDVPPYAILSHTWGKDEVLFTHIYDGSAATRTGFRKIRYAADQARADGYRYVWIDSCCIDKRSSAELSEAINSMYAWYRDAAVCYAFLEDVPANVDVCAKHSEFTQSRWFTRGWCLQELLAPRDITFFSNDWTLIGDKQSLCDAIARITKIDLEILTGEQALETTTVAKRMSWAARRKTTRGEDVAYCLMGMFSVNMPMLYGEGKVRAFHRLQEEIMKYTNDQTIFAWVDLTSPADQSHGLLADGPEVFAHAGDILLYSDWEATSFDMSNRGLRMELYLTRCSEDTYAAALSLFSPFSGHDGFLAIYLKRLEGDEHQFARVKCANLGALDIRGSLETVFVRQQIHSAALQTVYALHCFQLRYNTGKDEYAMVDSLQNESFASEARHVPNPTSHARAWVPSKCSSTYKIVKREGALSGAILLRRRVDGESFVIMMGSITKLDVGFDILEYPAEAEKLTSFESLQKSFNPQPAGTPFLLKYHRVRVDAQPQVKAGMRLFMIDITVESIPKELNPLDMLMEVAENRVAPLVGSGSKTKDSKDAKDGRKIWRRIALHRD